MAAAVGDDDTPPTWRVGTRARYGARPVIGGKPGRLEQVARTRALASHMGAGSVDRATQLGQELRSHVKRPTKPIPPRTKDQKPHRSEARSAERSSPAT